jgi:hypothetical protein
MAATLDRLNSLVCCTRSTPAAAAALQHTACSMQQQLDAQHT